MDEPTGTRTIAEGIALAMGALSTYLGLRRRSLREYVSDLEKRIEMLKADIAEFRVRIDECEERSRKVDNRNDNLRDENEWLRDENRRLRGLLGRTRPAPFSTSGDNEG